MMTDETYTLLLEESHLADDSNAKRGLGHPP